MDEFIYRNITKFIKNLPDIFKLSCTNKFNYQSFWKMYGFPDIIEYCFSKELLDSKYGHHSKKIWKELRKGNTVLTGSFLLSIIHQWPKDSLPYQDIDLYSKAEINQPYGDFTYSKLTDVFYQIRTKTMEEHFFLPQEIRNNDSLSELRENVGIDYDDNSDKFSNWMIQNSTDIQKLKDYLKKNGLMDIYYSGGFDNIIPPFNHGPKRLGTIPYYQSEASKFLHSIREYNLNHTKLQIIETRCHPKKCIQLFDFDFCQVYYDFKKRKIIYLKEESVKTKTHIGPIQSNRTYPGRKEKYMKRGYRFVE